MRQSSSLSTLWIDVADNQARAFADQAFLPGRAFCGNYTAAALDQVGTVAKGFFAEPGGPVSPGAAAAAIDIATRDILA